MELVKVFDGFSPNATLYSQLRRYNFGYMFDRRKEMNSHKMARWPLKTTSISAKFSVFVLILIKI